MEPPSTRPWLGVGAALSALPAAGGCFCAALVLAVVADSDPSEVYEQHRWLGAIVAASAMCAYVAMMGWATLRHGGLPAPVLLIALVLSGVPFLLPGGLFLPAAAIAVAGCAALVTAGLQHPPASPLTTRAIATGLGGAAVVLALTQAIGVGLTGAVEPPRARVLADAPHRAKTSAPAKAVARRAAKHPVAADDSATPAGKDAGGKNDTGTTPAGKDAGGKQDTGTTPGGKDAGGKDDAGTTPGGKDAASTTAPPVGTHAPTTAPPEGTDAPSTTATPGGTEAAPMPDPSAAEGPVVALDEPDVATAPPEAAPDPVAAAARAFVRDYYAALSRREFGAAWQMLSPAVQRAFGGFSGWRKGYARTVSHAPGGITVRPAGAGATIGLTLTAGDRGACGRTVERRFAVTWQLARTAAGWRATGASARKLSGPEPC